MNSPRTPKSIPVKKLYALLKAVVEVPGTKAAFTKKSGAVPVPRDPLNWSTRSATKNHEDV